VEHEALIEFATKSGILTAKKVPAPMTAGALGEGKLFIELDLPTIDSWSAMKPSCRPSPRP
jgi:hypothetical protein